nr:unnamed protein product [Spirometra erinaceieuropaei]
MVTLLLSHHRRPDGSPPRHLRVEAPSTPTPEATNLPFSNQVTQRPENLSAADENALICDPTGGHKNTVSSCPHSDAGEGDLDAPSVAALAPAGLCPRSKVRPAGYAGDKGDPGCRQWADHRLVISNMRIPLQPRRRSQATYSPRRTGLTKPMSTALPTTTKRLQETHDAWTTRKAEEVQGYADRNEWENIFAEIKVVYGPSDKGVAYLLSAGGSTLLTEKKRILE